MNISIITLQYNRSDATISFLRSLREQTDRNFLCVIVDNGSDQVHRTALREWLEKNPLPFKHEVLWEKNTGFAGGVNTGIRNAMEREGELEWYILLNNDTVLPANFIERFTADVKRREGIVGIPMDEDEGIAYCGRIQWLRPFLSHVYSLDHNEKERLPDNTYVIGGGMAISRTTIEKIGFMDIKYFLYFEDADYSIRAHRAGIPLFIIDVPIRHFTSSSTKSLGSALLLRYHYRNALYFNIIHGPLWVKFLVLPWAALVIAKQLVKLVIRREPEKSKAILAGVRDFLMDRCGKLSS